MGQFMTDHWGLFMPLLAGLFSLAGAFGAFRVLLNGTVKRVERIESKLDAAFVSQATLQGEWRALRADTLANAARIDRVQTTVNEIQREQHDVARRLAHLEGQLGH